MLGVAASLEGHLALSPQGPAPEVGHQADLAVDLVARQVDLVARQVDLAVDLAAHQVDLAARQVDLAVDLVVHRD